MPLPNFIIIGAMKSGTSTLHSNLSIHPEIGMSRFKEPNYFNKNYKRYSLDWYKSLFSPHKKINGESSPNYSKKHMYPGTAERMFKTLPEVKIIYLTRDPLERITSHLHHNVYRDRLKEEEVNKVVIEDKNYLLTSKYHYQIEEYLKYYSYDQFLFITTEELKEDLNGTLNKICSFLGLEAFNFSQKLVARNRSSNKFLIKKYDAARSVFPSKIMKLYHWFYYFTGSRIGRPVFEKEIENKIKRELETEVLKFEKLAGIDVSAWKNFNYLNDLNQYE